MRVGIIILIVSCACAGQTARRITGDYSNPAMGYEVRVPEGLVGITGDQAGPERGFTISLPSGGTITIYGEPNSLEWKTPMDGIRHALGLEKCNSDRRQATAFARMGRITATKGTLVCDDRLLEMLLAFRPGGGPVYWMTLRTTAQKRVEDEIALNKLAATFQFIRPQ
ncbi:MAG TPA: hypothetical protein VJP02_13635 [Candidatus Sulfotelmatobacter sp.]|nr:hypothetical protein [Candidatus Sulfotelmatobacter sp.]